MSEARAIAALDVQPLTATIGAEVVGVDVRRPLAEPTAAALRAAFANWKVLVLRGQLGLTPEAQIAFGARFGRFVTHPFRRSLDGHPELVPIAKEVDERVNVGGGWHTDMTFLPAPPLGTALFAVELPPLGLGDTLWSDNEASFAALSAGLKAALRGLRALHSAERVHGPAAVQREVHGDAYRSHAAQSELATALTAHPVVRRHPETGRESLFVNPSFTMRFDGWSDAESKPLLDYLFAHMTQPEYVLRLQWQPGTLVLWDNRNTQHYALNDYHGHRREMRRLMLEGDAPF